MTAFNNIQCKIFFSGAFRKSAARIALNDKRFAAIFKNVFAYLGYAVRYNNRKNGGAIFKCAVLNADNRKRNVYAFKLFAAIEGVAFNFFQLFRQIYINKRRATAENAVVKYGKLTG